MDSDNRYDYMLDMPYKKSLKRRAMSRKERAAQFGAFRALTGFEDAIAETGRLTDFRIELDEYRKAELDRTLQYIRENVKEMLKISVTYFVPDIRKEGGEYVTHTGIVKKLRESEHTLVFCDDAQVPIDEIIDIEIIKMG